jgi:hypothetical protein
MSRVVYEVVQNLGREGSESIGFNLTLKGATQRAKAHDLSSGYMMTPHAWQPRKAIMNGDGTGSIECEVTRCNTEIRIRPIDD